MRTRSSILALVAVAALGATALVPSSASAFGRGGGFGHFGGLGHRTMAFKITNPRAEKYASPGFNLCRWAGGTVFTFPGGETSCIR